MVGGSDTPGEPGDFQAVARMMHSMELDEVDMPHVVITRVRGRETLAFSGPYPSGMAALAAAECEHQAELEAGCADLSFHVAALYPSNDLLSDVVENSPAVQTSTRPDTPPARTSARRGWTPGPLRRLVRRRPRD
jgi:hypothetical protein